MRVVFEADTLDDLIAMARGWAGARPKGRGDQPEPLEDSLLRIKSQASLKFLRLVAARSLEGQAMPNDAALRRNLGLSPEGTIVGVLGLANRIARRRAGRDIVYSDQSGHRMSEEDARVVIATLGPP